MAQFVDSLPSGLARRSFEAWIRARNGRTLPELSDFAPHDLPPAVWPWLLIHRLRSDGSLVYGLAGEALVSWFDGYPKGKPVLHDLAPDERERRIAWVRRSVSTGTPFWFGGVLAVKGREHVPMGRLCLPATDQDDKVLLLIYFALARQPGDLRGYGRFDDEAGQIVWCGDTDLMPLPESVIAEG